MSLFKICTWWQTQCPDVGENYDAASLLCCRFGLYENEKDFIVVGSQDGTLSIFYPQTNYDTIDEFRPTDLILETKFSDAIIGVLCGKFSGSQRSEYTNQLAVLHLHKISIFNVMKVDGVTDEGNSFYLQISTEHQFKRAAFSACKGPFGKIHNRDFICVTHMDGNLTFFEQDGISYNVRIPGFSLPTVIKYVPRTDSFVRVNFSWELECFSYQDLSQSSSTIKPVWFVCLGEFILDICQVQLTNEKTVIMVLGEHNLISVTDEGRLQFILKLDYSPKCFCSFVVGWYWEPNASLITAVVSESSTLLVYNDQKLIWASQLEQLPVAIRRSNCSLPGSIITLTETGFLHIGFLGSEPLLFKVPPLSFQEMNFEKAHQELQQLEAQIKNGIELEGVDNLAEDMSASNELEIEFSILSTVEACTFEPTSEELRDKSMMMCAGGVRFKAKADLAQLQITFLMADKIRSSNDITTLNDVAANTSEMINTYFYLTECVNIATLKVEAFVSYINMQGIPKILRKSQFLPLNLFYVECSPQKDAAIKLVLSYTKDSKNTTHKLNNIFSNFFKRKPDAPNVQALGLQLSHTNAVVTVVAAKNNPNRFRIQSDCLEAMPAVLEAMINYAKNWDTTTTTAATASNSSDNMLMMMKKDIVSNTERNRSRRNQQQKRKDVQMAPQIPSDEIIRRIRTHHDIQKELRKQTALMDALWNQFKLFQMSLQSKKDDEAVDGLMMLIEKNYDDLVREGDKLILLKNDEFGKSCDLSCATSLTNQIISCLNVEKKIIDMVTSVLTYPTEDWLDKSWEETVDPCVCVLHHHPLLHSSSKANNKIGDIATSMKQQQTTAFDYDKFEKHITTLMERLQRLASNRNDSQKNSLSSSSVLQFGKINKIDSLDAISNIAEDATPEEAIESEQKSLTDHRDRDGMLREQNYFEEIEAIEDREKKSDWMYVDLPSADALMLQNKTKIKS